ncbi:Oxidoreductase BOA17 [Cladobotryum mycophilum]|uniref:Oxidoreductase BOA17 n=1 Tax=Cladobotryum mycophilum TaxID=491253 RepID=A0ABR0SQJ1_9HYPO
MTKIWLVTGSSRGLGRALAEAILQAGDSIVATARKPEQLQDLVDQYGEDKILAAALDVTDDAQVNAVVQSALSKFGRLDVVVNNAGYADVASIEDTSLETFRTQFETNFFGVVNVTKAVLPILRKQGHGHIFQVSSVGGRLGSPGLGSYQSAKWAIGGFSTVLSKEVGHLGIKVTVLEPGGMKTDWAGSSMGIGLVSEPYRETVAKFQEVREQLMVNWADPKDVVRTILHVADAPEPPLRLLLGPDTMVHAKKAADDLAASDEKWRDATMLKY